MKTIAIIVLLISAFLQDIKIKYLEEEVEAITWRLFHESDKNNINKKDYTK